MRTLLDPHFTIPVVILFLTNCRLGDLNKRGMLDNNQTEDKEQDNDGEVLVGVPILYEQRKYVAKELGIDPRLIMGNMRDLVFHNHYPTSFDENSKSILSDGVSLKRMKRGIIWNKIQRVKKGIQRVQKSLVSVRNRITKLLKGNNGSSNSTETPKYPTTAGDGGPKWKGKGSSSSSNSGSTGGGYGSTAASSSSGGNGWGQSGNSGGHSETNSNGGYSDNQGGYSSNSNNGGYSGSGQGQQQGGYSNSVNSGGYSRAGVQGSYEDKQYNGYTGGIQTGYEISKPLGHSAGSNQGEYNDNKQSGYVRNNQPNSEGYANPENQGYANSDSMFGSSNTNSHSVSSPTMVPKLARGDGRVTIETGATGASAVGHSSSTSTAKYPSYSASYKRSSTSTSTSSKKAPVSAVRSARELEMIAQRFDKNVKSLL